jgi:hypothetical protein
MPVILFGRTFRESTFPLYRIVGRTPWGRTVLHLFTTAERAKLYAERHGHHPLFVPPKGLRRQKLKVEALSLPTLRSLLLAAGEYGTNWVSLDSEGPLKERRVKVAAVLRALDWVEAEGD